MMSAHGQSSEPIVEAQDARLRKRHFATERTPSPPQEPCTEQERKPTIVGADSTAVEARDGSLGIWLLPVHAAYANLIKNVWDYCAAARCWTLALLCPSNRDIGCLWVRPPRMLCIRDGLLSVGLALMRRESEFCLLELFQTKRKHIGRGRLIHRGSLASTIRLTARVGSELTPPLGQGRQGELPRSGPQARGGGGAGDRLGRSLWAGGAGPVGPGAGAYFDRLLSIREAGRISSLLNCFN